MPCRWSRGNWSESRAGFISAGEFLQFLKAATAQQSAAQKHVDSRVAYARKMREDQEYATLKREELWAREHARSSEAEAAKIEAEARRLEELLGSLQSAKGASGTGPNADEACAGTGGKLPIHTKQLEAIKRLSREMKQGGSRQRVGMQGSRSSSVPMLPSLMREEMP